MSNSRKRKVQYTDSQAATIEGFADIADISDLVGLSDSIVTDKKQEIEDKYVTCMADLLNNFDGNQKVVSLLVKNSGLSNELESLAKFATKARAERKKKVTEAEERINYIVNASPSVTSASSTSSTSSASSGSSLLAFRNELHDAPETAKALIERAEKKKADAVEKYKKARNDAVTECNRIVTEASEARDATIKSADIVQKSEIKLCDDQISIANDINFIHDKKHDSANYDGIIKSLTQIISDNLTGGSKSSHQ